VGGFIQTAVGSGVTVGEMYLIRSGCRANVLAVREDLISKAVVDRVRRQHHDTRMLVLAIVPGEEAVVMTFGYADAREPGGEIRSMFERLELRLVRTDYRRLLCGRECDLITPRFVNSCAISPDFMLEPRSACSVSSSGLIGCFTQAWVISCIGQYPHLITPHDQ
jgi:hypothetical protein